jgi:hypothetical protein
MSAFTWLDYSDHDRRRALDVIDLFRAKETRDELGIGTVRDALSDLLFPGTSTIQTRARYFLFVPWIYLRHEERGTAAGDVEDQARRDEYRLIDALADSKDTNGVIGIEARRTLQRLPSHVYWQGLRVWGLRTGDAGQSAYHRLFASYSQWHRRKEARAQDGSMAAVGLRAMWHPGMPRAPEGLLETASFAITEEEAQYLRERILSRCGESLLAFLVDRTRPQKGATFPWRHPDLATFSDLHRQQLEHARLFSTIMFGSALMYNLMLAGEVKHEKWEDEYRQALDEWESDVKGNMSDYQRWDRQRFWAIAFSVNPRIPPGTRRFIEAWIAHVMEGGRADDGRARQLVRARERQVKIGGARLGNPSARARWGGESGAFQVNYRWHRVEQIVNDIAGGLRRA